MVKHNNAIPGNHFHKDWKRYVKCWFNQPARKDRRRKARERKASEITPRPLKPFRPLVQGQTIKYCGTTKTGRGFTLEELKRAGLTANFARTVGVKVDHRRRNKSAETLQRNVQRLEVYKSKLTLYPLKKDKPRKGEIDDVLQ